MVMIRFNEYPPPEDSLPMQGVDTRTEKEGFIGKDGEVKQGIWVC